MMIKANRTPHHQPEGSPGYADHPSLTPLRRGFFFSASQRIATPSSRSGRRRVRTCCCARPKEWCRVRDLNSRPTVYKDVSDHARNPIIIGLTFHFATTDVL